ncbi:MAG: hypothetical protein R3A52_23235 [Polyangiales bacterium]
MAAVDVLEAAGFGRGAAAGAVLRPSALRLRPSTARRYLTRVLDALPTTSLR